MSRAHHNMPSFQTQRGPFLLLLSALVLLVSPASAQVATGTPPFGSFGGGPDILNLATLNTHNTFPVFRRAGRAGLNFTYDVGYDSSVWYPAGSSGNQTWVPAQNFNWLGQTQTLTGSITFNASFNQRACFSGGSVLYTSWWLYQNYGYSDPFGTPHGFYDGTINTAGTQVFTSTDCGQSPVIFPQSSFSAPANDGSGYNLNASDYSSTVTAPANILFMAPINNVIGAGSKTDRNGNYISVNGSGVFTDTLGTTALTISGSGTPASPIKFTYTAPSGPAVAVQINYTQFTVATNFGISGISEYGAHSVPLPTSIALPDGSSYSITYEATPSTPTQGACTPLSGTYQANCVTARVASVTLPTGGSISYSYSGGYNGIWSDGSTATLTRTLSDGAGWSATWTYARSQVSGNQWQTLITDPTTPTANQTLIYFQKDTGNAGNYYEVQRQVFQSSTSGTLLQTVDTCYNGAASPCSGTNVTTPINRKTEIIQYPNSAGVQCKHESFYNSLGLVTEVDDYNYGSGAVGSLIRKTLTTYGTGLLRNFPATVTVQDGSAATKAQTTYAYDQWTPTAPPGTTPNHTSGNSGNVTTITYLTQGSSTISRTFTYWNTGMVKTATDFNGANTTYNYLDATSTCGNAFPTSVSEPLSMSRSFAWNCTGSVKTSFTDENSQVTTLTYSDPYFWRPAKENFPDTGQTSWTYNSQTSVTTATKMNSTQNIVGTVLLDGLGRSSQTQLNSDPQGVDYSVTKYDAVGRLYQVYNPTRCSPPTTNCGESTWGYSTTLYDALGRVTQVTLPDGSVATTSYSSNTVTTTDPAGKKRASTFDSLGRLTQVTEDPGGLGYVTTYSYDALSNLTSVTQNGGRTRTFAYDAMSRLTSETNPESGTITYNYDVGTNKGDLTSRVAPAPNQTGSATVTTTYSYDILHRLTQKSYSDGTPQALFTYDLGTIYGVTMQNPIGRLVVTNSAGGQASTIISYDPMGRVNAQWQCTPYNCGTGSFPLSYSYDLAGDMTSYTNGVGVTFTQTFDSASRPSQLISSYNDSQHPATLASGLSYMPASAYTALTLGNGLLESRAYNNRLQPTEIKSYTSSNFVRYDFTYGYGGPNNNGTLSSWNSTGWDFNFNRTYSYDSLNRLATMGDSNSGQSCKGLSWTHDAWGNRTDQTVTAGTCNTFHNSVNPNNQLVGSPYQYDAAGNMTHDASHSYAYDAENRLISVDGGSTATYVYDALGHRVRKSAGGNTDYIYDLAGNVVTEYYGTNWGPGYVYLNGQLLAQYSGGTTYFAQQDHLGSTRLFTAVNGSGAQSWDYLPYGELLQGVFSTTHLFTGDQRDSETNLDHTWFRQYSSQLGRWMHPDPAGLAAVDTGNPQSWNQYSYVMNDPMDYVDPDGLDCQPIVGYVMTNWCNPNNPLANQQICGNVDGAPTFCQTIFAFLFSGAAGPCPSSNCRLQDGPGGLSITQKWVDYQAWTTGDYRDGSAVIHVDPAHWETISITDNESWWGNFFSSFFTTNPIPAAVQSFKEGGCNRLLVKTLLEDVVPLPVPEHDKLDAGEVIEAAPKAVAAAGYARASLYSASRGLVKPLSSGTYRALRAKAIVASRVAEEYALPVTIIAATGHALWDAGSAAYQGDCH